MHGRFKKIKLTKVTGNFSARNGQDMKEDHTPSVRWELQFYSTHDREACLKVLRKQFHECSGGKELNVMDCHGQGLV